MTQQHPITPPPELVQQLCDKAILHAVDGAKRGEIEVWLIQEAFRAGADQELEACCELTRDNDGYDAALALRADRRPKPPSLKYQALKSLGHINKGIDRPEDTDIIRRALEQLDD
ncbi:hypothetical protein EBT31_19680 [bacterium]|jgi:hypothetical protein|nr:hypothetical protein [bacterium]